MYSLISNLQTEYLHIFQSSISVYFFSAAGFQFAVWQLHGWNPMRSFHAHHTIMIKKMFTQSPTARFAPSSDRKTWIKFVDAKESKELIKKFQPILPFGNPSTDFASESSSIQIRRRENGRDFVKNVYNFRVCVSPYYWHLGQMKRMACALTHTDTHLSSNTQTMKSQKIHHPKAINSCVNKIN